MSAQLQRTGHPWGYAVLVVFLLTVVFTLAVSPWVWLPDAALRRTIVLARVPLPDGERLDVTQEWTDDFYFTSLQHWDSAGTRDSHVIDNDMEKCWVCVVESKTNHLEFRMPLNRLTCKYYPKQRSLSVYRE